jgi:hypothetical protein
MYTNNQEAMNNAFKIRIAAACIAIIAGCFTASQGHAAAPPPADNDHQAAIERSLERALNRHIIYPLSSKGSEMAGVVHVSLNVDRNGRLEVLECRSSNTALADYVRGKLDRVVVPENPSGIWKTTHIRFVFRPERA